MSLRSSGLRSRSKRALDRKCIRPDPGLDPRPRHRRRDRKALAGAGRPGADGGSAAAVAQVVEEDAAAAAGLRGEDVVVREAGGELGDEAAGDTMGFVMTEWLMQR